MRQVVARALTRSGSAGLGGLFIKQAIPMAILGIALWILRDRFLALDVAEIRAAIEEVSWRQFGVALWATAISFWAIGRYDEIVHRLMGTHVSNPDARRSGATAVAISQFAGFGVLTGTLVRWRMVESLSFVGAVKVAATVSGTFLLGWGVAVAFCDLFIGDSPWMATEVSILVLGLGGAALAAPYVVARWPAMLPNTRAQLSILFAVSVDLGFAAIAFYALLPAEAAMPVGPFITAFFIAIFVGLASGTPGGVGAFELALLAQLPGVAGEPIIAAALVFRVVYHVLPAVLAAGSLYVGPAPETETARARLSYPRVPHLPPRIELALWNAPWAEAKLVRQGEFGLFGQPNAPLALAAHTGQTLVCLGQPLDQGAKRSSFLDAFEEAAAQTWRVPFLYKTTARMAIAARQRGWEICAIAREAVIATEEYTETGSKRRQLRRFLRKAGGLGLRVVEAGRRLPVAELQRVAEEWARARGRERGFSMGRFDPEYLEYQRVFMAYRGEEMIGFISFHEARVEWTLDLMRQTGDAPDGTMHLLMHHALGAAKAARVPRVSLASVQIENEKLPEHLRRMTAHLRQRSGADGLTRFKASFAPKWETQFAAAPSRAGLALAAVDVARQIHHGGSRRGNWAWAGARLEALVAAFNRRVFKQTA